MSAVWDSGRFPDDMPPFEPKFPDEVSPLAWHDSGPPRAAANDPPARLKRLDEFVGEYTPLSYAIEPTVRTGSLYSLTATTGSGKTALLISTAYAVVTGRRDILNMEVVQGRVAFLTFENPDDVRMRLMVTAYLLNVEMRSIANSLMVMDMRASPEATLAALEADGRPFRLVIVDTLAAMFDQADMNDNVQAGNFIRRLRPITRMPGQPAVVVAAHPVKNAGRDQLVPYGGGSILNEVDGNLTLWRKPETGTVELHWQGKFRGLEFEPRQFRMDISTSPDVLDAKGRGVELPTMLPSTLTDDDAEARAIAEADISLVLLKAMEASPSGTQRERGEAAKCSKSLVGKKLAQMKVERLVEVTFGRWSLTSRGEAELKKRG